MLDFRIETFLKVCECMNYTRAAEILNITQPAVTQHIHYLEAAYGEELLHYQGKKLTLTSAGQKLYQASITMKNDLLLLKEDMHKNEPALQNIRIGTTLSIGEYMITDWMKSITDKYPDANIHVTIANTSELLSSLKENHLQFAFVEGSFPKEEFDSIIYATERFIPVCAAKHTFQTAPSRLRDLTHEKLLLREEGSGTREILETQLRQQNLSIHDFSHCIEVNGMHAIRSLLSEDFGISFLYETVVHDDLVCGTIHEIPLQDFHVTHDFSLIWNKNSIYGDVYRALFEGNTFL